MKNCLVVFVVLVVCLFVAAFLEYAINENFGWGFPGGLSLEVAQWRDYDDPEIFGLEVVIFPDQIIIDIPAAPVFKQVREKGRWSRHVFYCDSHLDSPAEVEVARETKDENLVIDLGRFLPRHPGKIELIKEIRGSKGERPPYPVEVPGQTVQYPPPKGLIRVGMLACDLRTLPWRTDRIDVLPGVIHANTATLSDGHQNRSYFPSDNQDNWGNDEPPQVWTYHSDRPDAPKLLVTVYHGRVTEVTGGAEETSDIPYQLPAASAPPELTADHEDRSWAGWLLNLVFGK